jgi:aminoglycoside/choline kinase family phosphotransferase
LETVNLNTLLEKASVVLRAYLDADLTLHDPVVIKDGERNRVVRCGVASAQPDVSSIIIKQIKKDPACGFSDWASLAFLSTSATTRSLVPRFYGGDVDGGFFLMEDLGDTQSLQDVLRGSDPGKVQSKLRTLAVQMARLHAATLANEKSFQEIRQGLPGYEASGRHREAEYWLANRSKLLHWFQALDCALPQEWEICLSRIAKDYARPGGFLSFTHGDPAPTNNYLSPWRTSLLDFEYGGFRHALYDITAWQMLCPLPIPCVTDMRRWFRHELAKSCAAARDPAHFEQAWAYLCAYRGLAILTWISPDVLQQNRPWVGDWTMREAVLAAVTRLSEATANFVSLQPVHEAATRIAATLRSRWPEFDDVENVSPRWPAFRLAKTG